MKAPRIARSEEEGGEMQENNDNAYMTSLKIDTDTNRIIATAEEQADSRRSSEAHGGGGGVTVAAAVAVGPDARPARWSAAATAAYTKIEFFLQLGQMESKEKENKTKTENGRE